MRTPKVQKKKKRIRKPGGGNSSLAASELQSEPARFDDGPLVVFESSKHSRPLAIVAVAMTLITLGLYGSTFLEFEYQWRTETDYSHGYLVPLLSLWMLYVRRESFPGFGERFPWTGVGLLLLAVSLRTIGRLFFLEFVEGWSIVVWLAGCVALLAGMRALWWAFPALAFLLFMVPLPYQVEHLLSWKLQSLVTLFSSATLRILGFPAVAEGNTIWIGQSQMLVEEACSGLRIFVGMAAFGFFWATLIKRAWIDKFVVVASIVPLSIIANTIRSVIICISYHWFDDSVSAWVHDGAGILMIFLAAFMVWLVKQYWELAYRPLWVSMPGDRLRGY